jgi:hypothetical protein
LLGVVALATHGVSRAAFGRLLSARGPGRRHRSSATRAVPLGGPVVAVAEATVRSVLRSTMGRLVFLFNPLFFAVLAILLDRRAAGAPGFAISLALGSLAGAVLVLQGTLGVMVNQFGGDREGLTLILAQPLLDRQIVAGKLLGFGVLYAIANGLLLGPLLPVAALPASHWLALLPGAAAAYLPAAAAASLVAAAFPVPGDLTTLRGRQSHEVGTLASFLLLGAALPPAGLALYAVRLAGRPALAPLLVLAWLAIAALVTLPLVRLAAEVLGARRENLAHVAQGR